MKILNKLKQYLIKDSTKLLIQFQNAINIIDNPITLPKFTTKYASKSKEKYGSSYSKRASKKFGFSVDRAYALWSKTENDYLYKAFKNEKNNKRTS